MTDTADRKRLLRDPEWLRTMYWEVEWSMHDIARYCGVRHGAVLHFMRWYNIPRRTKSEAKLVKNHMRGKLFGAALRRTLERERRQASANTPPATAEPRRRP